MIWLLLAGLLTTSSVFAYDRSVTIVNESSATIVEIYGSNTGTKDWEENLLGGDSLPSNSEVEVDFNDETGYCMFDFLIIFEDKSEMTEEKFNVCDYGTFTVTN
jgi:hypothetical protein